MSVTEPRALPDAAIPAEDIQAVLPGLTFEQAQLAAQLATVAVQAAIWPNEIPDPLPQPVYAVLLQAGVRFGIAIEQGSALPVVSESLGAYSYRVASPSSLAGGLGLTDRELELLAPWIGGQPSAFDLYVGGYAVDWPADWWQRDYDRLEFPPSADSSAPTPIPAEYLTETEGDARYSQLGHTHPSVWASEWNFASSTAEGDPGPGKVRLDNADPATASFVYLAALNNRDVDWSLLLTDIGLGDQLQLQDRDDAMQTVRYEVTGTIESLAEPADWVKIPIAVGPQPVTLDPSGNMPLLITFYRPGHP